VLLLVSFAINILWLSAETIRMASEKVKPSRQEAPPSKHWLPDAAPEQSLVQASAPGPDATLASIDEVDSASSSSAQQGVGGRKT